MTPEHDGAAARPKREAAIGLGALALGIAIAVGARGIRSEAGYGGVGPDFLPMAVGVALALCGALLTWQALRGGWRAVEAPSGAPHGHWAGFAAVSVGLLAAAALITTIGFVLACALCYGVAAQGFRAAEGQGLGAPRRWLMDLAIGIAIAAPVFWLFTQLLGLGLPGLTATGWL